VGLRWRLAGLGRLDLREGDVWSEPHLPIDPNAVSGLVMVRLSYDVPSGKAQDFVAAMNDLGRVRRRDGATWWGLFAEVEHPGRYTELFSVASWEEHVRQAERLTRQDLALLDRIASLTTQGRRPNALHGLAVHSAGP
jgi:hypothetical protein